MKLKKKETVPSCKKDKIWTLAQIKAMLNMNIVTIVRSFNQSKSTNTKRIMEILFKRLL